MKTNNDQPGEFPRPGEVRLVRLLPGPIERVWEFLTDSEKRARWFAGGTLEPRVGGKLQLHFRHGNIAPDETPPDAYKQFHEVGHTMEARILRWEPPRVLSYTFGDDPENSDVTFELTPQGDQVLLVLTHSTRGPEMPYLPDYATGWHTHLAQLVALLENAPRPPFWSMHSEMKPYYERIYASAR